MNEAIIQSLSQTLPYHKKQIQAVMQLLEEGNTIPFIARYRKERTQSLDEVAIQTIQETYQKEEELLKRKTHITQTIEAQGKMTPSLEEAIRHATTMTELEALYQPYKQKRKTKAMLAKEHGLVPLAKQIAVTHQPLERVAHNYINESVPNSHAALEGAQAIVMEYWGQQLSLRHHLLKQLWKHGVLETKKRRNAEDEQGVYEMYYAFSEPISRLVAHRILAINRGEKEKILNVHVSMDDHIIQTLIQKTMHGLHAKTDDAILWIENSLKEALKQSILPSVEKELRHHLTEMAEEKAIAVFGDNLSHLLLQVPMKEMVVMGFDPAYRTGCKLAIVDEHGQLLTTEVIYPTASDKKNVQAAKQTLEKLIRDYHVRLIAIGNGTASRESEQFVSGVLKDMNEEVYYTIVSEAGASVYSASELAREEFPDLPVEKRSAISIARRIQDPLSELIKIDPKSVGVGQYQHDVNQKALKNQLDFVVDTTVNKVGVNVNTASVPLLMHISGLNKTIAQNIVAYRDEVGGFTERTELRQVKRLGPKTYEQAVGFLRLPDSPNPFDHTDIHPESYSVAQKLLEYYHIDDFQSDEGKEQLHQLKVDEVAETLGVGRETMADIIASLQQPGRDMRDDMPKPILRTDILTMDDLTPGMELTGTVRNVVDFGAFVDIGVKQDGLVHLSQLSTRYVKHPNDVVSVGDIVTVWVKEVDHNKQRIALTMIDPNK